MKSKEKDTLRSETQDEPKSKEQVLTFSLNCAGRLKMPPPIG